MRVVKYSVEIKHYLRYENKGNKNKVSSYCTVLRCETIKQQQVVYRNVKFTNLLSFKLDFQKVDQHTGGKWGGNIQGVAHIHNQNYLATESLKL